MMIQRNASKFSHVIHNWCEQIERIESIVQFI